MLWRVSFLRLREQFCYSFSFHVITHSIFNDLNPLSDRLGAYCGNLLICYYCGDAGYFISFIVW